MPNTNPADVTLAPAADGTYAIAVRCATPEIARRVKAAGLGGHFLGYDPENAGERARVEDILRQHLGADVTVAWLEAS